MYLTLQDKVAGKPVTARAVTPDGRVVAQDVMDVGLVVAGSLVDRAARVGMEAVGHRRWEVSFRWNIKHKQISTTNGILVVLH